MTRRSTKPARPAMTKRLVAHRGTAAASALPGPDDGDAVWLAAPCARLRAGYYCECGYGFEFRPGWPDDWPLARVEPMTEHQQTDFREEEWVLGERHGRADRDDDAALAGQIENLLVGTIVERHGLGIAPLFESLEIQPGHEPMWMLDVADPF